MSLTPSQWAALLPLLIPVFGACVVIFMSLDRDQTTTKWIRGAMYGTALLAVAASFWYLTDLWKAGSQPDAKDLQQCVLGLLIALGKFLHLIH